MTDKTSSGVRRRDFLAGAAALGVAAPLMPRAAFAQGASNAPPADTAIARIAIHPALGICRVGNSAEWFYAPEVPGLPAVPDGRYKDGTQKIKKQAQRFRIYAFNKDGQVIREITAADAEIRWSVHVANTKGAWYGFNNPLDNGDLAPGLPGQLRNQAITDWKERAEMLAINPGARGISGANVNPDGRNPAYAMVGRFWRKLDVPLGHLRTDAAGRLVVFPGDGLSQSAVPDNPITNFSDNDGWHDDWCDGPVRATVTLKIGDKPVTMEADNAWVACCGPDFAPDIPPFISLYDVIANVASEAGWLPEPKAPLSFRKYIYPLFHKLGLMDWVSQSANLDRRWIDVGDFLDPAYMAKLADPSAQNKEFRVKVFKCFRDPESKEQQQYTLPYMLGDGINYSASELFWFRIPQQQYKYLALWADGQFTNDLDLSKPETVTGLDQIPLSEQPEALTRAALEPCSGGAFHPGVELTWPLRHKELYSAPFRIKPSTERDPTLTQNLGLLLTPEVAFKGFKGTPPAVGPQMPGDLTRWMGLPWQCDAFSCQYVMFSNDLPTANWWPALLPIDVLPEIYYQGAMDAGLSPDERVKFFQNRVLWSRGVAGIGYHANASYTDGLNAMLYLWDRMGFVVRRDGPTDANAPKSLPKTMYVEVDRGSMDLMLDKPPFRRPVPR